MKTKVEGEFLYSCANLVFVTSQGHRYKPLFHVFEEILEIIPMIRDDGEIVFYGNIKWHRVENRQVHTWRSQNILGTVDEGSMSPFFAKKGGYKGHLIGFDYPKV